MFGRSIPFSPAGLPNGNVRVVTKFAILLKEKNYAYTAHEVIALTIP
jgi:hypothetical protein